MVQTILDIYQKGGFSTQVLAASINTPNDIVQMAQLGAQVVTAPFHVIEKMIVHSASVATAAEFLTNWDGTEL